MSNKDFFLRMVAAMNAGDAEHIAEWFTEDFKLHEPGVPLERVTGHEGARRMLHHLRTAILPETRFEILDMVEEGDRVAVRWLFSGVKDVIWS
jgi:predicted ester cyclase